jgi:phospholipid-binding lipoprotein MlaA
MRAVRRGATGLAFALAIALSACAPAPTDGTLIADPFEPLNRTFHAVNKGVDTVLLNPVSQAYDAATPALVRFLIRNGSDNLALPVDAINLALQGRFENALAIAGRFGFNTVFGAAGLLDPATEFGFPKYRTDFGETLYVWGVPEGAYVELPLLGPSTQRDGVGRLADYLLNPVTWFTGFAVESPGAEIITSVQVARVIETRAEADGQLDRILYESPDSYTELKTSYVQFRRAQLGQTRPDQNALPDIFDDPAEPPPTK